MHIKTEGVIIKEFRFRDTSKILTIFTKNNGKVFTMARGVYRPKSRLIANTQPFSYNDYYLYRGRNFYYINQADIIDSFYSLRENINRVMFGSYMLELVDSSLLEEEANEKLFLLLIKGLKVLSGLDRHYNKFILSYELKFISFLGYKPYLEGCTICGRRGFNEYKFNLDKGGLVCLNCSPSEPYCEDLDINMHMAMEALLYTPLDKVFSLKISENTMFKLHRIMVKYILSKIEKEQFNSLNIIKTMKIDGGR